MFRNIPECSVFLVLSVDAQYLICSARRLKRAVLPSVWSAHSENFAAHIVAVSQLTFVLEERKPLQPEWPWRRCGSVLARRVCSAEQGMVQGLES